MREKYKVGNNGIKKEVVNNIYNLMMLRDDRKGFFINKNHTATVMNEKDIKTRISIFSDQIMMLISRELKNSTLQWLKQRIIC